MRGKQSGRYARNYCNKDHILVGHVLQRRPLPARPSSSYITSPQFLLLHPPPLYSIYGISTQCSKGSFSDGKKETFSIFYFAQKCALLPVVALYGTQSRLAQENSREHITTTQHHALFLLYSVSSPIKYLCLTYRLF